MRYHATKRDSTRTKRIGVLTSISLLKGSMKSARVGADKVKTLLVQVDAATDDINERNSIAYK